MLEFLDDPVVQMYILFILYFFVPLVPSTIIYKLFPDTKVAVSGPLSGLNLKTSGAFAAYVATLVAGIFIINNTIDLIKINAETKQEKVDYFWKVKSNFKIEQDGSDLSEESESRILDSMVTYLKPELS